MLIVEDGTGVANANSYADTYELQEYAQDRGIVVPDSDEALEALLHKGMDYLRAVMVTLPGERTYPTQNTEFPRTIRGRTPNNVGVPAEIKEAQIVAALAALDGDLTGRTSISQNSTATRKTVGPITVEYSAGGASAIPVAYVPQVYALLRPWRGPGQPAVVRG